MVSFLRKIQKTPFRIISKEICRRSQDMIYSTVRGNIVKRKAITIDSSIFQNWESDINLSFKVKDKAYYIDYLNNHSDVKQLILQADKICSHKFDLLGSGEVSLGETIKWNQDFKSGFVWGNNFYKRIKTIDLNNNADVKVPWELSRFQHVPLLGQAYWITADEKYADEFKSQIEDWITKNPVEMSVNWACTMDVAIRSCNWVVGIEFFKNSDIKNEFWVEINKWLFMHGEFIYKNLEKSKISNNHYLSNLVGLIWLAIYFRNISYKKNISEKWLEFGLSELEIEMQNQVYEDGCNFEASTAYHCLVTELLLYTSVLCSHNNINFTNEFEKKLEKMCELIMNITKPNGLIPLIGDMDSGRFIVLSGYGNYDKRDFRYLLDVAGEYFNRDDFRYFASNQITALWMFNEVKKPPMKKYELESVTYPDGGYHILRNERAYLIVRCGQNGTAGIGGHTHNDQLSFELNIDGEDFIVDSGSPAYTSNYKLRNKYRGTAQHNTVVIEGFEQNDIDEEKIFQLSNQTKAELQEFDDLNFKGRHFGFSEKTGIIHEREISIRSNTITILDKLNHINSDLPNPAAFNIIFDRDAEVIKKQNGVIVIKNNVEIFLNIGSNFKICDSGLSYEYGKTYNTKQITVVLDNNPYITEIMF
ncbi:alginate lyase family protein [Peribacillus butanolivorans]|uniref:alginate lyase family protein n=1 Tax=Peribacillus butanolivorans TaxID=421767 RepID=UPI0036DA0BDC